MLELDGRFFSVTPDCLESLAMIINKNECKLCGSLFFFFPFFFAIVINNVCTVAMPRKFTRSGSALHSWYTMLYRAYEL